ncbi:MAG: acetyl-CoA hydrolase/transferase family protein [Eubacterium sp.]|nr:acetyl-CoA hydrolase/transferase family protein [Eubacterium sp.]
MSWKEIYESRVMTAEEALKKIPADSRVFFAHSMSEPTYLVDYMCDHKEWFTNVEICHLGSSGKHRYCNEEGMEGHLRHNSFFVSGLSRKAVSEGRADFTPAFFHELPRLIREKVIPVDALLLTVTPPDKNGKVSLGLSCDYTKECVKSAPLVIAQVNDQWPFAMGGAVIDVSEIDCFIPHNAPIPELQPGPLTEVELGIGKNCAALVEDGDTIQLGIGSIPDAVCASLTDKKDLGVHTELMCDGVMNLVKAGVITNAKKKIDPGVCTAAFIMGTRKMYDFVDHNPLINMQPVDYTNHPVTIAKLDHIVSINSAVQVDFQGQVCSESIGLTQISATGGQVDFVRGAAMADHGKAIIAMPSTVNGKISKIVPLLDEGATVTTCRCDVDYVITEYGIAHLKGKTLKQRSKALIEIAHPKFKPELITAFEERYHYKYE